MKALGKPNPRRRSSLRIAMAAAFIETVFPVTVLAADILEEVIVTARKRE